MSSATKDGAEPDIPDRLGTIRRRVAAVPATETGYAFAYRDDGAYLLSLVDQHTTAHRWNLLDGDNGEILVCAGEHEKADGCAFVRFVPATAFGAASDALASAGLSDGDGLAAGIVTLQGQRDEARRDVAKLRELLGPQPRSGSPKEWQEHARNVAPLIVGLGASACPGNPATFRIRNLDQTPPTESQEGAIEVFLEEGPAAMVALDTEVRVARALLEIAKRVHARRMRAAEEEIARLQAKLAEHARLHTDLNTILHPNGDGPTAPSLCDLVLYVRTDLARAAALRRRMADYTDGSIADEMRLLLEEDDARATRPAPTSASIFGPNTDIARQEAKALASPVERFFTGDMECEEHPGVAWPHGDCPGPGMPWTAARAEEPLSADARFAYRDTGISARLDGQSRPTEPGPRGDAQREGWDEEDRRQGRRVMAAAALCCPKCQTGRHLAPGNVCGVCGTPAVDLRAAPEAAPVDEDDGAPDAAGEMGGAS